jgi:hypothetical protein
LRHRISVSSQAYLDVSAAANPALQYGAVGIAGLGFDSLSTIDALVNRTGSDKGRSLLYNLFEDNKNEPNYIAFALQRTSDPNADTEGTFSIGIKYLRMLTRHLLMKFYQVKSLKSTLKSLTALLFQRSRKRSLPVGVFCSMR